MRFQDPILREILRKMRIPGGEKLLDAEWAALVSTRITGAEDVRLQSCQEYYYSSYL